MYVSRFSRFVTSPLLALLSAARLRGSVHAAAVACGDRGAGELCEEQNIHGFPVMMLYRWRKTKKGGLFHDAIRYRGEMKLAPALAFVEAQLRITAAEILPSSSSSSGQGSSASTTAHEAMRARDFLRRPAMSILSSLRESALAGNSTLVYLAEEPHKARAARALHLTQCPLVYSHHTAYGILFSLFLCCALRVCCCRRVARKLQISGRWPSRSAPLRNY